MPLLATAQHTVLTPAHAMQFSASNQTAILGACVLVFAIQAWLIFLRAKIMRPKGIVFRALKIPLDFTVSTAVYLLLGWLLFYGPINHGLFGGRIVLGTPLVESVLLAQALVCGAVATAVSHATGEREKRIAHSVLDAVDAAICIVDSTGSIIERNTQWQWLGCFGNDGDSPGVGDRLDRVLLQCPRQHEHDLGQLAEPLAECLAGRRAEYSAVYQVQVGESQCWLNATILPVDDAGRSGASVVSLFDVTERMNAEQAAVQAKTDSEILAEALASSQRTLASTLEAVGVATWQWDTDTGHVEFSEHWAQLVGKRPEEVKPHLAELLEQTLPEDRPALARHLATREDCGKNANLQHEFRVRRPTGKNRWMQIKGRIIQPSRPGVPRVYAGVLIDVSERKAAEVRSQAFARILEEASNELLLLDASTLRVIEANRGARENLGYSLGELKAAGIADFVTSDSHAELQMLLQQSQEVSSGGIMFHCHLRRIDGSVYSLAGRVQRTWFMDRAAIAIHGVDVTEKEALQAKLAHAQKLESIGQLTAGIAHEINTPLQYLGSNLEFLQQSVPQL
ncbi:MAG: PAS domain S-box protein, partial [Planctomycetota bacterium]